VKGKFCIRRAILLIGVLLFGFSSSSGLTASAQNGKDVFKQNCRACHALDKRMVGPALDGAFDRVMEAKGFDEAQTTQWLVDWIRNSPAVINSGDEYANQLFNDYNKVQMTAFVSLSDEEILAVIDYIRFWNNPNKYPPEVAQVPVTEKPEDR